MLLTPLALISIPPPSVPQVPHLARLFWGAGCLNRHSLRTPGRQAGSSLGPGKLIQDVRATRSRAGQPLATGEEACSLLVLPSCWMQAQSCPTPGARPTEEWGTHRVQGPSKPGSQCPPASHTCAPPFARRADFSWQTRFPSLSLGEG